MCGWIVICICTCWLLVGIKQSYKIYRENNGIPADKALALLVFFIFPSLYGLVIGIVLTIL